MKKTIKIDFSDFWGGYDKEDNYFYNLLKDEFDIEISKNPDFLFFSVFGNKHQSYNCKKIQYIGENVSPDLNYADYSFSFDYSNNERNYRLPHYLLYPGYYELVNKSVDESLLNRKFCNMVVSNPACDPRNKFFEKLSKYKKIDSGGSVLNNTGYKVVDKRKFQSEYKFSITYENMAYRGEHSGYCTEKIFEAMVSNSIPIYRGDPDVHKDFNYKSFVNYYDFKNEDEMIDYIIELDMDDTKYMEVLNRPWLKDNLIPENNKIENIKNFLFSIFQ